MNPPQLARYTITLLRRSGNERNAVQIRRYFKKYENVSFFGVKSPLQRKIERGIFAKVKGEWDVSSAVEFCEILVQHRVHECKNVGLMMLSRYHRDFDKSLFQKAKLWLSMNYCSGWALVDLLSPLILTPLIRNYPALIPQLTNWTGSRNLWVRRASAVTLIPMARHGQLLDIAYEIVMTLRKDTEDLIHKATGWLLREAGKTDARRLKIFLLQNGSKLPRTTIRYAIERFPKLIQKRLLLDTK
jgi:3-methyladenine DNA glycosylase AlkD